MTTQATALRVQDLAIDYRGSAGHVRAVNGVSFEVGAGELVAVVGETGSGKTTAALSSIGLLPENATRVSGKIEVAGRDITNFNRHRLRDLLGTEIGLIPQDPTASLNPLKPIGWQVSEAIRLHSGKRDAERAVTQLLTRVGLSDADRIARSYPHQLSGGQRQRALIAGAIAMKPVLLVADESTSALDVTVQRRVLDLLDELRSEEGTGILFVTHDLGVAVERANHIVVLRNGIVEDAGTPAHILSDSAGDYTRELVAAAPALHAHDPRSRTSAGSRAPHSRNSIQISGLEKRFGDKHGVHAVRGVDLTVGAGLTHSIVGESGSGKSTIARIVTRLEEPTRGQVLVEGVDIATLTSRAKRHAFRQQVQLVYQSPYASLNPSLTILKTVAEPLYRFGITDRKSAFTRAAELLERVALAPHLHERKPRELSGGQRQRVAIARALAPEPSLLVLDEPVSALDVSVQAQILDLLADLQAERDLTYLFISHDLAVVRQISDTVTVLKDGLVEEQGTVEEIFSHPKSEYTKNLLASIPRVDAHLAASQPHDPPHTPHQMHTSGADTQ